MQYTLDIGGGQQISCNPNCSNPTLPIDIEVCLKSPLTSFWTSLWPLEGRRSPFDTIGCHRRIFNCPVCFHGLLVVKLNIFAYFILVPDILLCWVPLLLGTIRECLEVNGKLQSIFQLDLICPIPTMNSLWKLSRFDISESNWWSPSWAQCWSHSNIDQLSRYLFTNTEAV